MSIALQHSAAPAARFHWTYDSASRSFIYQAGALIAGLKPTRSKWCWWVGTGPEQLPGQHRELLTYDLVNSTAPASLDVAADTLRRVLRGDLPAAHRHRDSFMASGAWYLFVNTALVFTLAP